MEQRNKQTEEKRIGTLYEATPQPSTTGIKHPTCTNSYQEVKSSTFTMLQENYFYGFSHEDPLRHLNVFERICSMVALKGASEDSLRLTLFPWSLSDKAALWERNVPSADIKTWEECKKVFLHKFFPREKTMRLRESITTFKQGALEELYEAWDRFKDYAYQCPHHGFTKEAWLGYFQHGLTDKWRLALNVASGGSFAQMPISKGEKVVENLANSERDFGGTCNRDLRESKATEARFESIDNRFEDIMNAQEDLKCMIHELMRKMGPSQRENHPSDYPINTEISYLEKLNYLDNLKGSGLGYREPKTGKRTISEI